MAGPKRSINMPSFKPETKESKRSVKSKNPRSKVEPKSKEEPSIDEAITEHETKEFEHTKVQLGS